MDRPAALFTTTLLCLALAACGGAEGGDASEAAAETAAGPSPCEILDDEILTRHFDAAAEEVTRRPSEYSPHPLCTASWPKPNAAEIEARRDEEMAEYMSRKMAGEDVERPSFRTTDEVSLTINKQTFESRDAAVASFDAAMRVLTEGMTVETSAGETSTPTYELEPVSGVGVKAAWVPGLHQLSVATERRIFHVGVRIDGGLDAELEKAKQVARDIQERM